MDVLQTELLCKGIVVVFQNLHLLYEQPLLLLLAMT